MEQLDKRRSSLEIIADMLRLGEAGKTEMMYSVNMSYFQLQKYLKFLLERGLIDRVALGNPSITYRVTRKGLNVLKGIDSVLEALEIDRSYQPDNSED
ncbi:MAG: winged helix-turn-helix domain-containing protein [Dehalococcoidales bacterium]|jgi:predicted transcriptional regulator|nr:winged helix-turn-helix domain-containing protein [Dehalococcoidales bacterium]MDD4231026.1 winged helix-turn-helix domain-containing protein [Dehalococcoidales bacterium]MDD5402168.1 winged helix-turn-helix domain-containing protein [Dehalococcoidales bacterium]